MHDTDLGDALLARARNAVAAELDCAPGAEPWHPLLAQPGATFVTLRLHGELRGCIGSLTATRPLAEDVRANAVAAAFRDPRFAPLTAAEFAVTRFEISLLAPAEPIAARSEAELLRLLRPHVDGVILRCEERRATLLPQVWASLPDPRDFVRALKRKAGLPATFWSDALFFERYEVVKFDETVEADR
jgi:AmmeMemoRadiSam system protein A